MYCKHCGKELADEAIMCPNCGTPTGIIFKSAKPEKKIKTERQSVEEDTNPYKPFGIISCILSILGLIFTVTFCSFSLALAEQAGYSYMWVNNSMIVTYAEIFSTLMPIMIVFGLIAATLIIIGLIFGILGAHSSRQTSGTTSIPSIIGIAFSSFCLLFLFIFLIVSFVIIY